MEKKKEGGYVSPKVKVLEINLGLAILGGSYDVVNEEYDVENI